MHNKKTKPEDCPLISPATVNRTTTEVLKKLFTCAKTKWGLKFDREPNWRVHLLREPEERVRELVGDEGDRLEAATPEDYRAFFEFVRASGLRRKECVLLRWSEINWQTGQIVKFGKGGRRITCPITPTIRAILAPLEGHHSEFVFTRVAKRSYKGEVRGRRYPLTLWGVNIAWKRLRKRAGVTGFRFHDFRHDFASRLLRKTGNLKIVQKALNHADIKTTTRYAHVLDSEVGIAMEEVSRDRRNSAENSPNKSPRLDRKVG